MRSRRILPAVIVCGVLVCAAGALAAGGYKQVQSQVNGTDGVSGLNFPYGVTVAPGGKHAYAIGTSEGSVVSFKRKRSGRLSFLEVDRDGENGVEHIADPTAVAVSPDGKQVYVSTDDSLATFDRNKKTGRLKYRRALLDNENGVDGLDSTCCQLAISRDGRNVYVPSYDDDAISVFARNKRTGRLSFVQVKRDEAGGITSLAGPEGVVISRDGKNVYAAASDDSALVMFKRLRSGKLKHIGARRDGDGKIDGLEGTCCSLAISRDGKHVIVPGESEDEIALFRRSKKTGKAKFIRAYGITDPGFEGMEDPIDVIFTRDGKRVLVANYANDTIVVLKRKRNGRLKALGTLAEGDPGLESFDGIWRLAESGDGKTVYGASFDDEAVVVLKRKR